MNVLIDTNVFIDAILMREPFHNYSALVLIASEEKQMNGYISASSATDIFYIVSKHLKSKAIARQLLKQRLTKTVEIANITKDCIRRAFELGWDDFEDCVQNIAAENIEAEYIITRNKKDFKDSDISIVTPEEFLSLLTQ
jgi:predicted nucleic acid-binding protein